jgi:hypothetical protein
LLPLAPNHQVDTITIVHQVDTHQAAVTHRVAVNQLEDSQDRPASVHLDLDHRVPQTLAEIQDSAVTQDSVETQDLEEVCFKKNDENN